MNKDDQDPIFFPPHGCVTEIAKMTGYSRTTVQMALRHNTQSEKAKKVRQIFREKYYGSN